MEEELIAQLVPSYTVEKEKTKKEQEALLQKQLKDKQSKSESADKVEGTITKKFMHKNNNLMAIEDLNMGEEVTYAMGSMEEDVCVGRGGERGIVHDKEKAKVLSRFVNNQMERILLSKLNSEINCLYVSGFNKAEGTVKYKQDIEREELVKRLKIESEVIVRQRKKMIKQKWKKIEIEKA